MEMGGSVAIHVARIAPARKTVFKVGVFKHIICTCIRILFKLCAVGKGSAVAVCKDLHLDTLGCGQGKGHGEAGVVSLHDAHALTRAEDIARSIGHTEECACVRTRKVGGGTQIGGEGVFACGKTAHRLINARARCVSAARREKEGVLAELDRFLIVRAAIRIGTRGGVVWHVRPRGARFKGMVRKEIDARGEGVCAAVCHIGMDTADRKTSHGKRRGREETKSYSFLRGRES